MPLLIGNNVEFMEKLLQNNLCDLEKFYKHLLKILKKPDYPDKRI